MLTLYHAPHSRSSRVVGLLHAMGVTDQFKLKPVQIRRQDGSGAADSANPHPEGKVPVLVHDGVEIWESPAILIYLSELFPDSPLSIPPGHPLRGRFLSWITWYGDVMEPVMLCEAVGITHPALGATFRSSAEITARLAAALGDAPWLMGDHYTSADLLLASPYHFFGDATPDVPVIRDWVARCKDQPWQQKVATDDTALMGAMSS